MSEPFELQIIGRVKSPYQQKFAIPRQPGLATAAHGEILLTGKLNNLDSVRDIQQFSHLWILFLFHETAAQGWQPLVKPPRLGGNKKTGVLATRSNFRPNSIGMSVVKLEQVAVANGQVSLKISGHDLLNNTPVIDIKPYLPYCDSITDAKAGWAQTAPISPLQVTFNQQSIQQLLLLKTKYPELKTLITQVLAQDPRPAYKKKINPDPKQYSIYLYDLNIQWQLLNQTSVLVQNIEPIKTAQLETNR
jgi:tRNA (adenine37-N6)-methyltransferase